MNTPKMQTMLLLLTLVLSALTLGLVAGQITGAATTNLIDDPNLERGVSQNAHVVLESGRFYRISYTGAPSKALFNLVHARPILWYRRAGGDLFVQIVVETTDLSIIAKSQKALLCTVVGVPIELEAGTTWYNGRLLIVDMQISATWALKWHPWVSKNRVDTLKLKPWTQYVQERAKAGKHKRPKGVRAPADSDNWARAIDREYTGANIDPKKYKQFTINTHKYKIEQLEAKMFVDLLSWWVRYEELQTAQDQLSKRYTFRQCDLHFQDKKWRDDNHFQACRDMLSEIKLFQGALASHVGGKWLEVNERMKYRKIEYEQHKRGLNALQREAKIDKR